LCILFLHLSNLFSVLKIKENLKVDFSAENQEAKFCVQFRFDRPISHAIM
jgi:hypothetical protein